jgi:hypothetical protein
MANDLTPLIRAKNALRALSRVKSRFAKAGATEVNRLLAEQDAAGTNPYGQPHAPLKRPRPGGPPLHKTGQSYADTAARPLAGAGIGIDLGGHLHWHLSPTSNRPARAALPLSGLPATWRRALEHVEQRAVKDALGKPL